MHIKYIIKLEDDINELVVKIKLKINKCYACSVHLIINKYFSYKMLLNIKLTTQLSITQFLVVTLLFIYIICL